MPTSEEWLKLAELRVDTAETRRDALGDELNAAQKEYEIWKEALKMARGIALAVEAECQARRGAVVESERDL